MCSNVGLAQPHETGTAEFWKLLQLSDDDAQVHYSFNFLIKQSTQNINSLVSVKR